MQNMKKQTIYLIIVAVLIISFGIYFVLVNPSIFSENTQDQPEEEGVANQPDNATEEEKSKLVTDDFEMVIPSGWESQAAPEGILALAVNSKEVIDDSSAAALGFKSYIAVTYSELGEKSREDYVSFVKEEISGVSESLTINTEREIKINGKDAHIIDMSLAQQGVNFRVLIFVVWNEDQIWAVSFNTIENKWQEYEDVFLNSAESFVLK